MAPAGSAKHNMIPMTEPSVDGPAIAIAWECLSNYTRDDAFTARLVLRNVSSRAIAPGWALYFNTCRKVLRDSVSTGFAVEHLNGDLFRLTMPAGGPWLPGQTLTVEYEALHWAISITDAPLGFYLQPGDGSAPIDLGDPEIAPFARPEQRHRMRGDLLPTADAAWRFEQDAVLHQLPRSAGGRITPRPRHGSGTYFAPCPPLWDDPALTRSDDKAGALAEKLGDARAIVMRGNGAVCVGATIEQAACLAWLLEDAAGVELAVRSAGAAEEGAIYTEEEIAGRAVFTGGLFERMWEFLASGDPEADPA